MFGIGNENDLDEFNLRTIASYPYQVNLISLPRFEDLSSREEPFRQLICNSEYLLVPRFCIAGGDGFGWMFCRLNNATYD